MDFETVWNGTHNDRDEDLLRRELREPVKRPGVPSLAPAPAERGAVSVANVLERHGPSSAQALVALTGLSEAGVRNALFQLRRRGQLAHQDAMRPRPYGRPERVYSLVREKPRGAARSPRPAVGRAR